jgi:hypothetical protein
MGILPNKRALYFHDRSDYTYEGEYTYEAFSNIHELEFVYPETIYNYTCVYYKDHIGDWWEGTVIEPGSATVASSLVTVLQEPYLDNAAIGYSLIQYDEVILVSPRIQKSGLDWYKIEFTSDSKVRTGYVLASHLTNIIEPIIEGETFNNELGRASFSCSIGDWNPDWDVFIETSWQLDENGNEINPTLYRDTELTLTWEYFGFERNLFKPDGYFDGIYLWNPRSWDHGDIHFSFNELVRTGSQIVLYPNIPSNMFKIANSKNSVTLPMYNA